MRGIQVTLSPDEIPKEWYNIVPDLPEPLPKPKDPEEGPSRLEILPKIFNPICLEQETSTQARIPVPEEVLELYIRSGRPRPLFRAKGLEKALRLPKTIKLYYKSEFYSPTGSHKVNTALPQVFFAREQGYERVVTETGAGQWGSALAYAASLMGVKCTVYWVRAAHDMKPERRILMRALNAEVISSPSNRTEIGRKLLKENPNHEGSLSIAISEAIEDVLKSEKSVYCLGSVLNHVLLHQTIIGLETKRQFEKIDEEPDVMIGCLGGGSNFGGFILPFVKDVIKRRRRIRFLAAQSESAPNLIKGEYRYDFGDHAERTPLLKMYTLGHKHVGSPIYAEGLRYHAAAPIISLLKHLGIVDAVAYPIDEKAIFEAASLFVRTEGFLPAPESCYAVRAAIDEALKAKKNNKECTIAFNISGHGFLDMEFYKIVTEKR
ncbi:MAG TPA: TrpB-like pyridoxal phosphate-dependent enzyme [Candidatus Korarchaeota archaeon]|nr:TrpB-like pyridoxal phosphate-dependent enzyme [Candidatus Korarchaeota archaeon]